MMHAHTCVHSVSDLADERAELGPLAPSALPPRADEADAAADADEADAAADADFLVLSFTAAAAGARLPRDDEPAVAVEGRRCKADDERFSAGTAAEVGLAVAMVAAAAAAAAVARRLLSRGAALDGRAGVACTSKYSRAKLHVNW